MLWLLSGPPGLPVRFLLLWYSVLFIAALWSPAVKADLLALVGDVYCIFVTFPCGIMGQLWYLIVLFPDLCRFSYLELYLFENCILN